MPVFWNPASAVSEISGKKAARATPIPALVAATSRSAEATSGRRCNSVDGRPVGTLGTLSVTTAGRDGEIRGRLAHQTGDGMLKQSALRLDIGQLRLSGGQLRLRLAHIQAGGDALVVTIIGELERLVVHCDRVGEKLGLGIQPAQLQIVIGQLALKAQPHRGHIGKGALRFGLARRHFVADAAPQIQVPGEGDARQIVAVISGLACAAQRPVGRLLVGVGMAARIDLREQTRLRLR